VVDAADGFDPRAAESAGVELSRLLWVRAPGLRQALRATESLLEAGGFGLLLLNLAGEGLQAAPAAWSRLARSSQAANAALVLLSLARAAGNAAEIALEMQPARARFSGTPPLLEALEVEALLVRQRGAAPECRARVRLRTHDAA
jgi:hypothetical protein